MIANQANRGFMKIAQLLREWGQSESCFSDSLEVTLVKQDNQAIKLSLLIHVDGESTELIIDTTLDSLVILSIDESKLKTFVEKIQQQILSWVAARFYYKNYELLVDERWPRSIRPGSKVVKV